VETAKLRILRIAFEKVAFFFAASLSENSSIYIFFLFISHEAAKTHTNKHTNLPPK